VSENHDWCFVIKYTHADYIGVEVDAHFVSNVAEAMWRTSQGPMRPGEMLRCAWVISDKQRKRAIALYDSRRKANRDWTLLMTHIEEGWLAASHRKVFRNS